MFAPHFLLFRAVKTSLSAMAQLFLASISSHAESIFICAFPKTVPLTRNIQATYNKRYHADGGGVDVYDGVCVCVRVCRCCVFSLWGWHTDMFRGLLWLFNSLHKE